MVSPAAPAGKSPGGVVQVTPLLRLPAGHLDGSGSVPHATSLASVPGSVSQAVPNDVEGSARPAPSTLPPTPRRTRRMLGVAPTVGLPGVKPMYSGRPTMENEQPS